MSSTFGKAIECRAAILWEYGKPLTVENITVDPPKAGEVRVRMVAAGICATDGSMVWGKKSFLEDLFDGNPMILGHEGAGIVESVGVGVTTVAEGDHVVLAGAPNCEDCLLCKNPKTNYCSKLNMFEATHLCKSNTRSNIDGKPITLLGGSGAFAEYTVVHEIQVVKVKQSADLKSICVISCAVITGYGTATHIAGVHSGSSCAVWGLGAIGLSTMLGCKLSGAEKIIGIDINSGKKEIAKKFGCTQFINPGELDQPIEEILQKDGGVEYAFDCVGNQQVIDSGLKSLTSWGKLCLVGVGPPEMKVEVNSMELLMGKSVTGSLFGGVKSRKTTGKLVEMYASGELKIDPLITHRISLDQINEGFDLLKRGQSIRSVIEF